MEREDRDLDPAVEVVAHECAGPQIPLSLEEHVVDRVIDVDQEAARGDGRGEPDRAGDRQGPGAGGRGGDEVAARTHRSWWGPREARGRA